MKVLITGATGLIGKELSLELLRSSHEVRILTRNKANLHLRFSLPIKAYEWDFQSPPPKGALEGVDAVVHLAGENVAGRWTSQRKKQIYDSRIISTKNLVSAINQMEKPPRGNARKVGWTGTCVTRQMLEAEATPRWLFSCRIFRRSQ